MSGVGIRSEAYEISRREEGIRSGAASRSRRSVVGTASKWVIPASRTVSVTVKNVGTRPSREVVQVYYRPVEPEQPVRLVGWESVTVQPGASATVLLTPEPRMWRRWDTDSSTWMQLSGGGELLIARGLGDIRTSVELP